ncbi:hypothetical protein AALP_AA8G137400 [Arabis alpina]|uniref:Uncharacterized protein n=1 Tax=Arabis alpina TaxID=50452 RepID=A0A087G6W0_ARAAL|nr:hypothetical protein AALP_AA8G137400 [Arabis alpina]
MERPRSFRSLARRTTGSGRPPTPTTATTSAAPTTVPAPAVPTTAPPSITPTTATPSVTPTTAPSSAKPTTVPASARPTTESAAVEPTTVHPSEPRDTSARKTTTAAKGSRLPSLTRTEIVAALPALPAPVSSDYDAKRAAKGKGHAGDDRKRSSDRDDVIDVDRKPKRARARSASPPRRVSSSVFESKASARSLFSTLVFPDDDLALNFLPLVNKVGHELEAKIEDLNEKLEDETRPTETARSTASGFLAERTAAWASIDKKNAELDDKSREIFQLRATAKKYAKALLTEAERSVTALAAAEEREQCSAAILTKRGGELVAVTEKLRQADEHIQSLHRKFTRARNKFDELQGDPRGNMVYQVQRVANLDFTRLLLVLLDGQEPPKLEDELIFLTADVAEHARDEEHFERLMKSLHGLLHVLDPRVKAPIAAAHDRTLEKYAASVGVADPSGSLLGGTSSCKAAVVGVDEKFSLIGGVGAEVTKSRIDDVAEVAGTVRAPEEMRTDEDFQGPRIDALTEDPRLDDVFGEMEAEGAPVTLVAPPGVDEETIPKLCFAHLLALLLLIF